MTSRDKDSNGNYHYSGYFSHLNTAKIVSPTINLIILAAIKFNRPHIRESIKTLITIK